MAHYIDGFILPLVKEDLKTYQQAAQHVAAIWKEYGAISYYEFMGDEMNLEGTRSFADVLNISANEVVIFGWVLFPSKAVRDEANLNVPKDPRMQDIVGPLTQKNKLIFDAKKMVYGGFSQLV